MIARHFGQRSRSLGTKFPQLEQMQEGNMKYPVTELELVFRSWIQ
jgi:hypothetical protein